MMWNLKFHRPELTETEAEFHRNDARIADLGERRVRNDLPGCDIPDLGRVQNGNWILEVLSKDLFEGYKGSS